MPTRRNTKAATRSLGKALRSARHRGRHGGCSSGPRVLCPDKAPTYAAAIATLIKDKKLSTTMMHRQVTYLNNVIDGDHGRLKRILGPKGGGFKKPVSVYRTLQGMESMHALRKGQGRVFAFRFLNPDVVIVGKALANA